MDHSNLQTTTKTTKTTKTDGDREMMIPVTPVRKMVVLSPRKRTPSKVPVVDPVLAQTRVAQATELLHLLEGAHQVQESHERVQGSEEPLSEPEPSAEQC
jgi:hypothetical protein